MSDSRTVDAHLIQAARAGDRDARAAILQDLADPWYRTALALLSNADDAREAVQEAAARLLRDLPKFRGDSSLRTWAIGIVINVSREMRRRPRRLVPMLEQEPPAHAPGPDGRAEQSEQESRLRQMLDHLPERQREAVLLRFFEDMSVDETAKAMQCAEGTVKATVFQALRALKRMMEGRTEQQSDSRER